VTQSASIPGVALTRRHSSILRQAREYEIPFIIVNRKSQQKTGFVVIFAANPGVSGIQPKRIALTHLNRIDYVMVPVILTGMIQR